MKPKSLNCITPLTDAEWAPDHPLRRFANTVVTNEGLRKFKPEQVAVVCGKPGDERLPCPPDDSDVEASCFRCGCALLRRASANPAFRSVCFPCWEVIS